MYIIFTRISCANKFLLCDCGIRDRLSVIEKLKYLNLEVNQGKVVNTKENINIRCRISPPEDHTWHSNHSQLNIIVDLIYNFLINWRKRQEELDLKLDRLHKEQQQSSEQYTLLNTKIDLLLQNIEEAKGEQTTISKNSDYIKEEALSIRKKLSSFLNRISTGKDSLLITECTKTSQDIIELISLVQEVKDLILS